MSHGKDTYYYDNGDRYDGEWKNGKRHGKGIISYQVKGGMYDGEWKNDKRHGKGIRTFSSGDSYNGEWKNDRLNGKGVYTYSNGDSYNGVYRNNMKHGKGVMKHISGGSYDGEYKNDKRNGKAVRTYAEGKRYVGDYKDGKKHGKGVCYYLKGDRYEGEYRDGKKNGKGVHIYSSGGRYEGEFEDGEKKGKGAFLFSSGDRHVVDYLNGIPRSITFFSSTGERGVFEMVGVRKGTGKAIFERNGERIERIFESGKFVKEKLASKKDNEPQKIPQSKGAKRKRVKNKPQKEVICFKFPRTTLEFRDSDTSDFVIKSYQRSTNDFKTTELTFIDSEDMDNPRRKEYLLSENNNTKLRELKMAIRRTYIIAPFTISRIDQPLVSEINDNEEDKLKIFLDKNQLGNYYSTLLSSGVIYEDLPIFVEDENAVDDFIQMIFHKRKFLKAIKVEFNC